jgi:hypothetical protein
MHTGFTPIRWIVIVGAFSCSCFAWSQSSGSSQSTSGVNNPSILSSLSSPGSLQPSSAVDASASAAVPDTNATGSLAGVYVVASVPGAPIYVSNVKSGTKSSALRAMGNGSSESNSSASSFNESNFSESNKAWGSESSNAWTSSGFAPKLPAEQGAQSPLHELAKASARAIPARGATPTQLTGQAAAVAAAAQHPVILSSVAGQNLMYEAASMSLSNGNSSALSNGQEQDVSQPGGDQAATGAKGGGSYAEDFPDSTRNTALLSPPDPANTSPFSFTPRLTEQFPDLAQYEFLKLTFHVRASGVSSNPEKREDLYQHIERRLREYEEGERPKNGLKKEKFRQPSDFENPFSSKTGKEVGLEKDSLSSGFTY